MKDWEEKGFVNLGKGTISLFSTGFQDCDKVQWDGQSPFPEHAGGDVEMPMFNIFDGGNGFVTIAEHKGAIVVEGTLWEKAVL